MLPQYQLQTNHNKSSMSATNPIPGKNISDSKDMFKTNIKIKTEKQATLKYNLDLKHEISTGEVNQLIKLEHQQDRVSSDRSIIENDKQRVETIKDKVAGETSSRIKNSNNNITVSKFKEKRPEPLKLRPTLNQDIPLDLSVKSAGNVPSGTLSSIFNLGPHNHLTTLETPRIQWQDNDALLVSSKTRLFSSSTNTSQGARISSLMSESPPITPNTPLSNNIFSSHLANLRSSNILPHSASLVLEAHPTIIDFRKAQILERWAQSNKIHFNQCKIDSLKPRRSSSTDDINFRGNSTQRQADNNLKVARRDLSTGDPSSRSTISKKKLVSPLAIKSLSNTQNNHELQTKFPYSNQSTSMSANDTHSSPTQHMSGKSITPTSVANATANLLNIHLNSPTSLSQSSTAYIFDINTPNPTDPSSPYRSSAFSAFDQDPSTLDTFVPNSTAAFSNQQRQHNDQSKVNSNLTAPILSIDLNNNDSHRSTMAVQHQNLSSISSSATLNTPTLVSPSQIKAGQLCFLQSPTLSPMSSLFDLSPSFLIYPQTTQQQQQTSGSSKNNHIRTDNTVPNRLKSPQKSINMIIDEISKDDSSNKNSNSLGDPGEVSNNEIDLVNQTSKFDGITGYMNDNKINQLITPAAKKIGSSPQLVDKLNNISDVDQQIDMDVDCELDDAAFKQLSNQGQEKSHTSRPATVIPQICVYDHHHGDNIKNSNQIDSVATGNGAHQNGSSSLYKKSLTPETFRIQVDDHRSDRAESSSAPPEVYRRRAKSKIKTFTTDSCKDLAYNKNEYHGFEASKSFKFVEKPILDRAHSQAERSHPYIHNRFPSSNQLQQMRADVNKCNVAPSTRSNSAEPMIHTSNLFNKSNFYPSSAISVVNSTGTHCKPKTSRPYQEIPLSNSAHQLGCRSQATAVKVDDKDIRQSILGFRQCCSLSNKFNINQHENYLQDYHYYSQQYSSSASDIPAFSGNDTGPRSTYVSACNDGTLYGISACPTQQAPLVGLESQLHKSFQGHQGLVQQNLFRSLDQPSRSSNDNLPRQSGVVMTNFDQEPQASFQTGNQKSIMRMLCNNTEFDQRQIHSSSSPNTKSLNAMPQQEVTCMEQVDNTKLFDNSISYSIDIDGRSDSRSSSSLDYSVQFSNRPNSEASSNLASKKYHCNQCSKSFTRSDMLTRHKRLHSGDRPFQCSECKQEFSRSDHLSTHMRTHTGEKPYKCKLCSYSACRKDMITRHLKVHSRSPTTDECI